MAHQNHQHHLRDDDDSQDLTEMPVSKEPAGASLGSNKLKELESLGAHEEAARELNAAVVNSTPPRNLSTTRSLAVDSSIVFTTPNPSAPPGTSVHRVYPTRPNDTSIDMPMTPPAVSPPHEDNNLGFITFSVELLNAITNLAVSSKAKHNQVLIYVAVACSTLAFSISSTALVLHEKRPSMAKKMQKAAFLIGTFGFLGMMGMLLPSSITWWFTIPAFLVCVLMFAVAEFIG